MLCCFCRQLQLGMPINNSTALFEELFAIYQTTHRTLREDKMVLNIIDWQQVSRYAEYSIGTKTVAPRVVVRYYKLLQEEETTNISEFESKR